VALNYVFVSVLQVSPVSIILHKIYTHIHLMSLVPDEQTVNVRKQSKINALSEINTTVTTKQYLGTLTIINMQHVAE